LKILSYNVNGIRAALNKGFSDWLKAANPDVLCLQEIKALKEQFRSTVTDEQKQALKQRRQRMKNRMRNMKEKKEQFKERKQNWKERKKKNG